MKKIITFLGTNDYEETIYTYLNEEGEKFEVKTRLVQEAIHNIVGKDAIIYIGLTERAKNTNWIDRTEIKNDKEVFYYGLKPRLEKENIRYEEISLKDGGTNEEMWENFERIFDIFEENDEVYLDVTHSFRSIPFIIMSILNYAKFIKNIKIKAIYYGAYDAKENGKTPIFNLSIFNQLTDWTIGAEKFINTGDGKQLSEMVQTTIEPILKATNGKDEEASIINNIKSALKNFSGGLYTVRGRKISIFGQNLKKALKSIEEINIFELKPFEKILDKIYEKVYFYSNDTIHDVHHTVKLCKNLNLIQQAYTLLQENIVSYLFLEAGIDLKDNHKRKKIGRVMAHYRSNNREELSEDVLELYEMIKPYITTELADLYNEIGVYRNDINHGGYRGDPKDYNDFSEKLDHFISKFEELIFNDNTSIE